jgi:hypothetical protein
MQSVPKEIKDRNFVGEKLHQKQSARAHYDIPT